MLRIAIDISDVASSEVEPVTHTLMKQGSSFVSFAVGETFLFYDDLKKKLAEFEKSHSVQRTHRDSLTLEAAARRVPSLKSSEEGLLERRREVILSHFLCSTCMVLSYITIATCSISPIQQFYPGMCTMT